MASSRVTSKPLAVSFAPQRTPRIRPPRFLKGEPRDDQLPQPPGPVPSSCGTPMVWAQGRWRNRRSNAARDRGKVLATQVQKALQHRTHGCNIYAYYHVQTKQVVYSLTRIMQSGIITPQLVFHGKKTVPAGLRRDYWRPYFSIHFPETDRGKQTGLLSYRRLREFAMRRQMDPDQDSLVATQEDIDRELRRQGNPIEVVERFRSSHHRHKLEMPLLGRKLPRKLRAEKLMNQKASSVADAAFVLGKIMPKLSRAHLDHANHVKKLTENELAERGQKGRKRLHIIRNKEEEKKAQITWRQSLTENGLFPPATPNFDHNVAMQMAFEHDGASVHRTHQLVDMKELPSEIQMKKNRDTSSPEVQVLWADIRDGMYAESWPEGVFHGELQPAALARRATIIPTPGHIESDGTLVAGKPTSKYDHAGSSVHIHGNQASSDFTTYQAQAAKNSTEWRAKREAEEEAIEKKRRRVQLLALLQQHEQTRVNIADLARLQQQDALGENLTETERAKLETAEEEQARLEQLTSEWEQAQQNHPDDTTFVDEKLVFQSLREDIVALDKQLAAAESVLSEPEADEALTPLTPSTPSPSSLSTTAQTKLAELEASDPARFSAVRDYLDHEQRVQASFATALGVEATVEPISTSIEDEQIEVPEPVKQLASDEAELTSLPEYEDQLIEELLEERARPQQMRPDEDTGEHLRRTQGVVVEERRGVWGRVKSLFSR